ncbi:carboxylesterase family protein [Coraliomargarita sp. W4R53]
MKYNRSLYAVLIFAIFLSASLLNANTSFEKKVYTSTDGKSLNYRIHLPKNIDTKKTYPLVLFLHGAGERGSDNTKQLKHGAKNILSYAQKNDMPVIIVAPQCPAGEQWVNTPWGADAHTMPEAPSASMQLTIELLKELQSTLPVDTTRIYATGLSMGGFGTWDVVQRRPETFAAAMPICGGGDTAMAQKIKNVPIWVFHGGADNVVKTKRSRDMVAALKKVEGNVKYTEYEGVGHGSWGKAYSDEAALKWLLGQQKNIPNHKPY